MKNVNCLSDIGLSFSMASNILVQNRQGIGLFSLILLTLFLVEGIFWWEDNAIENTKFC